MTYKLWTYPGNAKAWKSLITAQYVGVKIEVPEFQMGVDNKTAEFLCKNPNGKVPVLETEQGSIFESNACARYIARLGDSKGLYGTTAFGMGKVEQWIDFTTTELDTHIATLLYPKIMPQYFPYIESKAKSAQAALDRALGMFEATVKNKAFLIGDAITLADIIAFCNLYNGFYKLFTDEEKAKYPATSKYVETLANLPEFKTVMSG